MFQAFPGNPTASLAAQLLRARTGSCLACTGDKTTGRAMGLWAVLHRKCGVQQAKAAQMGVQMAAPRAKVEDGGLLIA